MTRYFKHYKNKSYKFLGEAKHSETLEDLVVYETFYKNDMGKLWVRPKSMFYENVTMNGRQVPRFAPIDFEIRNFESVSHEQKNLIAPLITGVFGQFKESEFDAVLRNHNGFYLQCAFDVSKLVGFKLGYQHDDETFYSWLGAVDPTYRGLGVASALMKDQHDWCQKQGFIKIQTKTKNNWRDMIILNLRNGFNIVGSYTDEKGEPKLILEKILDKMEQAEKE